VSGLEPPTSSLCRRARNAGFETRLKSPGDQLCDRCSLSGASRVVNLEETLASISYTLCSTSVSLPACADSGSIANYCQRITSRSGVSALRPEPKLSRLRRSRQRQCLPGDVR
jgi:hypothetical protein